MKLTWQCMFSPRLYKMYRDGSREAFRGVDFRAAGDFRLEAVCKISVGLTEPRATLIYLLSLYEPKELERWGDKFISSANLILNIGIYTTPFIFMYIYKKRMYNWEEARGLVRVLSGLGCLLAVSLVLRAYGRACNPKYVRFLRALTAPGVNAKANLEDIRKYDFDFEAWPVTFTVPPKPRSSWITNPFGKTANEHLPFYWRMTVQLMAFIATHTFGLRLIFPGSLSLVHALLWNALLQGRTQLVEIYNGKRTKIRTADGNTLDTLFVDHRDHSTNGDYLVICCEGNSGFYEVGIMTTPVKRGYSALGWNHPGFAGSTGQPYPEQEQNAIDAVMQYAINELGFQPEHIVMFGWSIGGYAAAWAAHIYPVYGLVLDATFDDLLPLAERQMPKSWSLLVREVVRTHVDLDVAGLVLQYSGAVQIVRRTEDEIISLRPGVLATNRGNDLLMKVIRARYPSIASSTMESAPLDKWVALADPQRCSLQRSEISAEDKNLLELIGTYMVDYKSSHCVPLPEQMFENIMGKLAQQKNKKLE